MTAIQWKFVNWKFFAKLFIPVVLLPVIFFGETEADSKKFKCAYVILTMGIFWMFELFPLAITALIPVALFPLLGIQSTAQVVSNYMRETQMMFLGGISLALALQSSGLHKRIALRLILLIGSSPSRLLLGILVTTMFLSCVIVVNTAVTAMMVPIVTELATTFETGLGQKEKRRLRVVFMLAIGYGANIGGTATLIGSQPNLIYKELIEMENVSQNGTYVDLNFFTFFAYSMPVAMVNLLVTWGILSKLYLSTLSKRQLPGMESLLKTKYTALGHMTFHELSVLVLLSLAVVLWLTRHPQVFPGWDTLFSGNLKLGDATVGIVIVLVMFLVPREPRRVLRITNSDPAASSNTILTWDYVQTHFPWNLLLIVGGGLAISDGAKGSGLSAVIGQGLNGLEGLSPPVILLMVVVTISVFTEIMSNAATISLLTPILLELSKRLDLHPLYLTLPGAIACQYAFVLPTSNPPNAIVFTAGDMRISDMAKVGVVLNFACIGVLYLTNLSWGQVLFGYSTYLYQYNGTNTVKN